MPEHRYPRGRIRPSAVPMLRYAHEYLTAPLPAPTYPISVWPKGLDPGMCGNDKWGDCVAAAEWHAEMATAVAAGAEPPAGTLAVPRYEQAAPCSSPPGPGLTIAAYLGWLHGKGLLVAYAPVNHRDIATRDAFLQAGYGLLTGVCLTTTAETLFGQNKPWGSQGGIVSPNLQDGHGMYLCGSTGTGADGLDTDVTWGGFAQTTDAWRKACTEELWLLVTSEEKAAAFEPTLLSDVAALHGVG